MSRKRKLLPIDNGIYSNFDDEKNSPTNNSMEKQEVHSFVSSSGHVLQFAMDPLMLKTLYSMLLTTIDTTNIALTSNVSMNDRFLCISDVNGKQRCSKNEDENIVTKVLDKGSFGWSVFSETINNAAETTSPTSVQKCIFNKKILTVKKDFFMDVCRKNMFGGSSQLISPFRYQSSSVELPSLLELFDDDYLCVERGKIVHPPSPLPSLCCKSPTVQLPSLLEQSNEDCLNMEKEKKVCSSSSTSSSLIVSVVPRRLPHFPYNTDDNYENNYSSYRNSLKRKCFVTIDEKNVTVEKIDGVLDQHKNKILKLIYASKRPHINNGDNNNINRNRYSSEKTDQNIYKNDMYLK